MMLRSKVIMTFNPIFTIHIESTLIYCYKLHLCSPNLDYSFTFAVSEGWSIKLDFLALILAIIFNK